MQNLPVATLPKWVPEGVRRYLAHTEDGLPIRELARREDCHASTILRQIRRTEARRDDPLVDGALAMMAANCGAPGAERVPGTGATPDDTPPVPNDTTLNREASRILRRLCETGSVLAVARGMDKAIVIRGGDDGAGTRTAVVEVVIAQVMALLDWISCSTPGKVSRYQITAAGRAALSRIMAEHENRARADTDTGFAEAQAGLEGQPLSGDQARSGLPYSRVRYNMAESPLIALARRRDKDGSPFLNDTLVRAGERLREDFELANMGTRITQDWDRFLAASIDGDTRPDILSTSGPEAARRRVAEALKELGPGLADVALRCCCHLEGLEVAEKRMGWSARSGKVVLRIALQRLKLYYEDPTAPHRNMMG